MSFLNKTEILIKKSDGRTFRFDLDNDIKCTVINDNLDKLKSFDIFEGNFSFLDVHFDISNDDSIYGLVDDKKGKLVNLHIDEDEITKETMLKYDYKKFYIKCPYIMSLGNTHHIAYLSIDKRCPNYGKLIHIYNDGVNHIKNTIDFISYNILNNFVILFNQDTPSIFYFNIVNGFDELFVSTFDINNLTWSKPIQLTKSKKNKIYLSVIKSLDNSFHIVFSENHNHKYHCFYMNISLDNDNIRVNYSKLILTNIMCLFPCLIQHNNTLYIQWVEYHDLYCCKSFNDGKTFTIPIIDKSLSNLKFSRYILKSNYSSNSHYSLSSVFLDKYLSKYN